MTRLPSWNAVPGSLVHQYNSHPEPAHSAVRRISFEG